MSDEVGEYYQFKPELKEKSSTIEEEKKLLDTLSYSILGMHYEVKHDGNGGERYQIYIMNERGTRLVDWWTSTNTWQVRRGRATGNGIYSLARYFNLIPRGAWRHNGTA